MAERNIKVYNPLKRNRLPSYDEEHAAEATAEGNNSENNEGGVGNGGFSWAGLATALPGVVDAARQNLSATQDYQGSVWESDNNNERSGWQTADALLGFGNNMFYAANPWARPEIQQNIQTEKDKFNTFESSLGNIQYEDLDTLAQARNDFDSLDLDMSLEDFGANRSAKDKAMDVLNSTISGASSGSIGGLWGMVGGAASGLVGGLVGLANADDSKSRAMYNEFVKKRNYLNERADASFDLQAQNIKDNNIRNMRMNMAAFGGYIGGNGGDWTNGLTFVNTGGSHSENPYGGVPMGIAPDGQPNLVEEGEVVWNDYVFSDRIKVPKDVVDKYKLKGKDMTFAKAVEKLQKSAEQRPNDSIEKRGLDATLAQLAQEQEVIRQQQAEQDAYNQAEDMAAYAADGGPIHIAKNKRGTFTAAATKHGMGVQEFARKVLANKEDYSPAIVRKANFARNASSWKHALGGYLFADGGFTENPTENAVETPSYYQLSDDFYNMLKEFEGFKSKRYADRGQNSIGYGFRGSNMPPAYIKDINKEMTKEEADEWLPQIVEKEIYSKLRNKKGFENLNPYQTEALVSYLYNTGMYGQPKLFKALADNDLEEVARQMNAGEKGVHKDRRIKEREWFNKPYNAEETTQTASSGIINEAIQTAKQDRMKSSRSDRVKSSKDKYAFGGHMFLDGGNFLGQIDPITGEVILNEYSPADLTIGLKPKSVIDPKSPFYKKPNNKDFNFNTQLFPAENVIPDAWRYYKVPTQLSFKPESLQDPQNPQTNNDEKSGFNASYLRYAPVLGSAISSIAAALDSPNRIYANNLRKSAKAYSNMMQPVSYRPLANYLRYDPLDRMFYANQLEANAAATRSAIAANANANRQAAVNNLLAANYGTNIGLGNLYRQVEEANRDQRAKIAEFNRGTDQYNATAALDAAKTNAAIRQAKANMLWDAAQRANAIDMNEDLLIQQARSQALTNLFNNLGGVGKEEYIFQMMKDNPDLAYYLTGLGNMRYKKPE